MLIVLGGLLGSGRIQLARLLAEKKHLHLYRTDSKKLHALTFKKDGSVEEKVVRPNTEQSRMKVYHRILAELPLLSKMYPDIILEDSFHRKGPRTIFLKEAAAYFDTVVYVWIDSKEEFIYERLKRMEARGLIRSIQQAMTIRKKTANEFQPNSNELVFICSLDEEQDAERLWQLIVSRGGS